MILQNELKKMDYRDTVFMSVAENLSFSKAAKELFISQPAVTKHIKELENKLDISLFERQGNKIYLTKAGELTYNNLKIIRQKYYDIEYSLERLKDTFKGKLRIGASTTISQYFIPKILAKFHKQYPQIELFLYSGNSFEIEKKLLNTDIDIALVENASSQPNIKYTDFVDDEIIVITSNNNIYSRKRTISLTDIQKIPMVLREKGSGTLEIIQEELARHNINNSDLNIVIHLGSTEAIKNFLCDFDGIALVSEKSVEKELQSKQIVKLTIKNFMLNRKFRLALKHNTYTKPAKLFKNFIFTHKSSN